MRACRCSKLWLGALRCGLFLAPGLGAPVLELSEAAAANERGAKSESSRQASQRGAALAGRLQQEGKPGREAQANGLSSASPPTHPHARPPTHPPVTPLQPPAPPCPAPPRLLTGRGRALAGRLWRAHVPPARHDHHPLHLGHPGHRAQVCVYGRARPPACLCFGHARPVAPLLLLLPADCGRGAHQGGGQREQALRRLGSQSTPRQICCASPKRPPWPRPQNDDQIASLSKACCCCATVCTCVGCPAARSTPRKGAAVLRDAAHLCLPAPQPGARQGDGPLPAQPPERGRGVGAAHRGGAGRGCAGQGPGSAGRGRGQAQRGGAGVRLSRAGRGGAGG